LHAYIFDNTDHFRPLPQEMFFYARSDTHFLLYIYDNMRNELIDRSNPQIPDENRIENVLQKSKETSLFRFERQVYNEETGKGPGGWAQLLVKAPAFSNNEQFAVFRAVHSWRDEVARSDDDSTSFVMPNHIIFSIAKLMPMDMIALLGLLHPISHNVKSRSGELLEIIKAAKARGKDGPSMMDVRRPNTVGAIAKANLPSIAAKAAPKSLVAAMNGDELRSDRSSFWGGAFGSSFWDTPVATTPDDGLRLAVPLPALSSEIFTSANGLTDRSRGPATPTPKSEPTAPGLKETDEPFVIKRGSKRKSDAISDSDSFSENNDGYHNISLEDLPENAAERAKNEKEQETKINARLEKKQRKKSRKERRAARAAAEEQALEEDDEEPFDYSKAESVLHGKRKGGDHSGSKKSKTPFDPYVKSADAPKGMRRLQTERTGKSHTFKS
jgi:exosome complex exonuclease RRP6